MAGYAKVFSDIVHSTVWREDVYTKVVWITMLVMADRHGLVMSSIPGLADAAKVSLEQCLSALNVLSSPDKYSRTKDYEGRRITEVDGGWLLLNFEKFRSRKDDEEQRIRTAERVRRHRLKLSESGNSCVVTENRIVTFGNPIAEASSSASPETSALPEFTPNKTDTVSGLPPDVPTPRKKNNVHNATARSLLAFLNEKTGRNYQPVKVNLDMISARLKEGATERQCRLVILRKFHDWGTDEKMQEYLRPATLFNRTKFAQYIGEIPREESHG